MRPSRRCSRFAALRGQAQKEEKLKAALALKRMQDEHNRTLALMQRSQIAAAQRGRRPPAPAPAAAGAGAAAGGGASQWQRPAAAAAATPDDVESEMEKLRRKIAEAERLVLLKAAKVCFDAGPSPDPEPA